jgi:hypothetical protein
MNYLRAMMLGLGLLLALSASALANDPTNPTKGSPLAVSIGGSRSVEPVAVADRLRGFVGIVAILALAYALSTDRRAVSGRVLFWGLALQWAFALLVLRVPAGERVLSGAGHVVEQVLGCALKGSEFVFGAKLVDPGGPASSSRSGCCRPSSSSRRSSPCSITWASCNGSCEGSPS